MTTFIAESSFWEIFPEAQLNVLIVKGINNNQLKDQESYLKDLLEQGQRAAKKFIQEEPFSHNSVIAEWRGALVNSKPKKVLVHRLKLY